MSMNRLAFLSASLAASTPAVAFADAAAPIDGGHPIGAAPGWIGGSAFGTAAILVAAALLLGGAALLLSGRINWRLGAIALVGGCALLGGDALLDGAWTAIAVSP